MKRIRPPRHPMYIAWAGMKARCRNKNNQDFHSYGALDIDYPPAWEQYENFFNDMHSTWSTGLTLDRIKSELGYSKENCRWATRKTQGQNTCRTILNKEKADIIRERYKGGASRKQLASDFKVQVSTICLIVNNKQWL